MREWAVVYILVQPQAPRISFDHTREIITDYEYKFQIRNVRRKRENQTIYNGEIHVTLIIPIL